MFVYSLKGFIGATEVLLRSRLITRKGRNHLEAGRKGEALRGASPSFTGSRRRVRRNLLAQQGKGGQVFPEITETWPSDRAPQFGALELRQPITYHPAVKCGGASGTGQTQK